MRNNCLFYKLQMACKIFHQFELGPLAKKHCVPLGWKGNFIFETFPPLIFFKFLLSLLNHNAELRIRPTSLFHYNRFLMLPWLLTHHTLKAEHCITKTELILIECYISNLITQA